MKLHEALAQSGRQLSKAHQFPLHRRRESRTKNHIGFMLAFGVNHSLLIRPDSLTTCNGPVRIFGRVRMCLASCWMCQTAHSVLALRLACGDERWHWYTAR